MSIFTILTYLMLTLVIAAGAHSLWHQRDPDTRPWLRLRPTPSQRRRLARSRA